MSDQTRFETEQKAYVILREVLRPRRFWPEDEEFFVIELKVPIHRSDHVDKGELSIYVERIDLSKDTSIPVFRYANRDALITTKARLSKEGKPFDINVFIPYRMSKRLGATVTLSEEVQQIILEGTLEEIERELS